MGLLKSIMRLKQEEVTGPCVGVGITLFQDPARRRDMVPRYHLKRECSIVQSLNSKISSKSVTISAHSLWN